MISGQSESGARRFELRGGAERVTVTVTSDKLPSLRLYYRAWLKPVPTIVDGKQSCNEISHQVRNDGGT